MNLSSRRGPAWLGLGSFVLAFFVGCGDGTPSVTSSDKKATVTGTVSVNGKTVTQGTVTFDPANSARKMAPATKVDIGTDGKYTLETLVGTNQISVQTADSPRGGGGQFDVQEGSNTHDIQIKTTSR